MNCRSSLTPTQNGGFMGKGTKSLKMKQKDRRRKKVVRERRQVDASKSAAKKRKMG